MKSTIIAGIIPVVVIAIAVAGSMLRRRRRAAMTLEQRRALEIVPWYRPRIR